MAGAGILPTREILNVRDLIHRVRGLRFFTSHICNGIAAVAEREGLSVKIDRRRIPELFVGWVGAIAAQKAASRVDRRDYILYSAGLLVERLLAERVIAAQVPAETVRPIDPAARHWPEGFLAVTYCLEVLDIVLPQEGLAPVPHLRLGDDMKTWWSFRENALEDVTTTVPFFDLLVGNRPNWEVPTIAAERWAIRAAATVAAVPPLGHAAGAGDTGSLTSDTNPS